MSNLMIFVAGGFFAWLTSWVLHPERREPHERTTRRAQVEARLAIVSPSFGTPVLAGHLPSEDDGWEEVDPIYDDISAAMAYYGLDEDPRRIVADRDAIREMDHVPEDWQ